MKAHKLSSAALAALLACGGFAHANTGADLLDINTSARAAALGQAYTAVASSVDAINWNPAGLARTPSFVDHPSAGLTFSHQDHFSESNIDYFGLALPARGYSNGLTFGLTATRLGYAPQERRLASGEKTGTINSSDVSFGLSAARSFGLVKAGTQLKMVRLELDGRTSQGMAMDIGFLAPSPVRGLSLGLAARNIGPQMKFIQEQFNLPLALAVGAAYQVKAPLTISMDLTNRPHEGRTDFAVGAELLAIRSLSLRTGYIARLAQGARGDDRTNALSNGSGFTGIDGLNAGMGLRIGQFSMDFSMSPFGELGNTQILTLSTWFGASTSAAEKVRTLRYPSNAGPNLPENRLQPSFEEKEPGRIIMEIDLPSESESWWGNLKP